MCFIQLGMSKLMVFLQRKVFSWGAIPESLKHCIMSVKHTYCPLSKTSETGMLGSSDYISLTSPLNTCVCVCMHAQSCPTLCELIDCSLPGFSVHGIIPARILEWVTISSSGGSSQPRDQTCSSPCVLWLLHWLEDSLPRATREAPLLLWLEATHLRYMLIKLNCI